ncbi:MAG: class I SAM-dependent methyltransferase [Polyangiaceae bacterium]|nr:class I SAM-dependent methyltransferase [Polyangiaceae bacterium]
MTDYAAIYRLEAERYDAMVSAEDVDREVRATIAGKQSLVGATVVEVGVGTGRITRQLMDLGARVIGVEPEAPMLRIAHDHVRALGGNPADLVVGALESLPFADASADLGVAGWVFGHQRTFEPDRWRRTVTTGVRELDRVVRKDGWILLFETLGTAIEAPGVRPDLAELQSYLEEELGFSRSVLRTDYSFASADEAAEALGFFFGDAIAARIRERGWSRVPEWTGCWARRSPGPLGATRGT